MYFGGGFINRRKSNRTVQSDVVIEQNLAVIRSINGRVNKASNRAKFRRSSAPLTRFDREHASAPAPAQPQESKVTLRAGPAHLSPPSAEAATAREPAKFRTEDGQPLPHKVWLSNEKLRPLRVSTARGRVWQSDAAQAAAGWSKTS